MLTTMPPPVGVIDCGIHHSWVSQHEIVPYLSPGWRDYFIANVPRAWHDHLLAGGPPPDGAGLSAGPMTVEVAYHNPEGDYLPDIDDGASGSDPGKLGDYLTKNSIERAILCHGSGALVPGVGTPRLAIELVRAINDWTIDRWLSADPRLHAAILVPTEVPEIAAREIRRIGRHRQMVAVLMTVNGLGKPFGHPAYYPIYAAAAELGLPVIVEAGGDALVGATTYPAAGGLPGSYSEYRVLAPQVLMTHVLSLICQGVLETYPSLRFVLLGGSVGWIKPFLWRFDNNYKSFRLDSLWLKDLPSTNFYRRFLVGTHPFRYGVSAERLASYLAIDPGLADVLCYSSGLPSWDSEPPSTVQAGLPTDWSPKVMRDNALRFFNWPTGDSGIAADTISGERTKGA